MYILSILPNWFFNQMCNVPIVAGKLNENEKEELEVEVWADSGNQFSSNQFS